MSQGTLRMHLHKKEPYSLSAETVLRLALDISQGMRYLHSQGVIHRDLKSNNLLLNDEMKVKVADFGTSCLETQCQASKGNMGTYRWMAPEMIKEKPYTKKVDVYSFGIVLWELTTALVPFQGMTPVQAAYASSEKNMRPPLSTTCSPVLNHLIKKCWSANPAKRPEPVISFQHWRSLMNVSMKVALFLYTKSSESGVLLVSSKAAFQQVRQFPCTHEFLSYQIR
ncbi:uncharacterized protein A4U43_C01F1520 [Asparagus officinalis]|uniref:Protein kinase domain-containing protein n=1 Tax=Asparagus officinalis TaxID=4686 RepID=A0A5P1FL67_ASPOF|nr:uncharacterized protein A4U43_C01F1520 [Asparagus officinalis]